MMVSEIRYAGYDPAGKGVKGFKTATQTSLSYEYWNWKDLVKQTIGYDLYDFDA